MKQAIKDKNIERIKKTMDGLTQASHKLAEAVYRQSAQSQTSEQPKAGAGAKEKVVDAEYEENQERR